MCDSPFVFDCTNTLTIDVYILGGEDYLYCLSYTPPSRYIPSKAALDLHALPVIHATLRSKSTTMSTLVSLSSQQALSSTEKLRTPSITHHSFQCKSKCSQGACPESSSLHSVVRVVKNISHKNPLASPLDELVQKHPNVGENEATDIEAKEFSGVASGELETNLRFVRMSETWVFNLACNLV